MPELKTLDQFIKDAELAHGGKYRYDKAEYKGNKVPLLVTCQEHGDFWQAPNHHLRNRGCPSCGRERMTHDTEGFVRRCAAVHGNKYGYSKTKYIHSAKRVVVSCHKHGDFPIVAATHLKGCGCKRCGIESRRLTTGKFIQKAVERHGDLYDYDEVVCRTSLDKVTIRCKKHGGFKQTANAHLQGNGCSRCRSRVSKPCLEWLSFMAQRDNTYIQHGANGGEAKIRGTRLHADGFSPELNKVYEFLGDYYHGNPRKYVSEDMNKKVGATMGELYQRTCTRRRRIQKLNYEYEEIWEDEFGAANALLLMSAGGPGGASHGGGKQLGVPPRQ